MPTVKFHNTIFKKEEREERRKKYIIHVRQKEWRIQIRGLTQDNYSFFFARKK